MTVTQELTCCYTKRLSHVPSTSETLNFNIKYFSKLKLTNKKTNIYYYYMVSFKSKLRNFISNIKRKIFYKEMTIEEFNKINNIGYNKDIVNPDDI